MATADTLRSEPQSVDYERTHASATEVIPRRTALLKIALAGVVSISGDIPSNTLNSTATPVTPPKSPDTIRARPSVIQQIEANDYAYITDLQPSEAQLIVDKLADKPLYTLNLRSVQTLSPQVASILSQFSGNCLLLGITALSANLAAILAQSQVDNLSLNQLTQLENLATIRHIATFNGSGLSFAAISTLSLEEAQALTSFHGSTLGLMGLEHVDDATIQVLAAFPGFLVTNEHIRNRIDQLSAPLLVKD